MPTIEEAVEFLEESDNLEELKELGNLEILKEKLKLGEHVSLLNNKVVNHVTPESSDKKLSQKAIENLNRWYVREFEFIEQLKKLKLIQ